MRRTLFFGKISSLGPATLLTMSCAIGVWREFYLHLGATISKNTLQQLLPKHGFAKSTCNSFY